MCSEAFSKFLFMVGEEMVAVVYCSFLWKISEATGINFTKPFTTLVVEAGVLSLLFQICPKCYIAYSQEVSWADCAAEYVNIYHMSICTI